MFKCPNPSLCVAKFQVCDLELGASVLKLVVGTLEVPSELGLGGLEVPKLGAGYLEVGAGLCEICACGLEVGLCGLEFTF